MCPIVTFYLGFLAVRPIVAMPSPIGRDFEICGIGGYVAAFICWREFVISVRGPMATQPRLVEGLRTPLKTPFLIDASPAFSMI